MVLAPLVKCTDKPLLAAPRIIFRVDIPVADFASLP